MNEQKYKSLAPADRAVIDKLSGEAFAQMAGQGFVDQDNHALPLIKQNGIKTHEASPAFMTILRERVGFYKANWLAAAKSRSIDGEAAYDYYVKTAQESASLMKR